MKASKIAALTLAVVGFIAMSLDFRPQLLGPSPEIERDPLKFTKAYWNAHAETLILVRSQMWVRVDLHAASLTGAQFKYDISPRPTNSFTMADFHPGTPDEKSLQGFIEVPLLTSQGASFAYKNNGFPWIDHEHKAEPPQPLGVALYRGHGHYADDNRTFWGSYLFATDRLNDGRAGVEFFYHPGTKILVKWQSGRYFPLCGGAVMAVCLLTFFLQTPMRAGGVTVLAIIALGLHGLSSFGLFIGIRYGEAWSGQGECHNLPTGVAVAGLLVLVPLIIVKYALIESGKLAPNGPQQ